MKVFNGILFTLFVVLFVGCTESVVVTDTPEFPPGLASALVDEKIISDLKIPPNSEGRNSLKRRSCRVVNDYVFGDRLYHLAEQYLGNGVWKVQLVDSTGKLVAGAFGFGPYE